MDGVHAFDLQKSERHFRVAGWQRTDITGLAENGTALLAVSSNGAAVRIDLNSGHETVWIAFQSDSSRFVVGCVLDPVTRSLLMVCGSAGLSRRIAVSRVLVPSNNKTKSFVAGPVTDEDTIGQCGGCLIDPVARSLAHRVVRLRGIERVRRISISFCFAVLLFCCE
jgi:hypothetical protein